MVLVLPVLREEAILRQAVARCQAMARSHAA